uniref:Putative ABC transporter related n=1 Tax=Magnetococcus massalia (strain MO-1) TaxID=451514 RepID=A0A1S7LKR1_MAGMO|nr:putative ABC transporter related [Candidatus Magnetococcus massalia]
MEPQSQQPLLQLNALVPRGEDAKPLNWSLQAGEQVAICGEEGCGKSTLMRILAGLLPPVAGEVRLAGRPLSQWPATERAAQIGVLFRQPEQHFLTAEVGEEIGFGLQPILSQPSDPRIAPLLEPLRIPHSWWGRPLAQLSAGQRARVALAAVLVHRPPLLLADEPGALLSEQGELELAQWLTQQLPTLLIFTSRPSRAARFAQRVYTLEQGLLIPA